MALERSEMTIDDASHLWFLDHFKSAGSRRRGDYLSCIKRWQAVFCDEQFLTIMFDGIIKDAGGVLVRLCRHLGVDTSWVGDVPAAERAVPIFAGPGYDSPEPLLAFLRGSRQAQATGLFSGACLTESNHHRHPVVRTQRRYLDERRTS